ncbi:MAG TPA: DUF2809 domain-containing protein [Daejeonella sp.]|nr:DUF2809 domain-containing protein [Daejeonella sp.]
MFLFNRRYFILTVILFITEVLIALFVKDGFIRPYFGDFLVVILLYCMIRSFLNISALLVVVAVLLFCYLIETLQYFQIVERLGLSGFSLARTLIGTDFAWMDMLAYTLGALAILWAERKQVRSVAIGKRLTPGAN